MNAGQREATIALLSFNMMYPRNGSEEKYHHYPSNDQHALDRPPSHRCRPNQDPDITVLNNKALQV